MIEHWTFLAFNTIEEYNKESEAGESVRDLISDLSDDETSISVYVSGDTLLDIVANGKSLGWFFVKAACDCYGFSKPDIIHQGYTKDSPLPNVENEYIIPTFGELACVY